MASWDEVAAEVPDLAELVWACFARGKHCTLATLRSDGSPRISGTEVERSEGQLWLGSMPGAVKARDLQRDPRCALHSPTIDPPAEAPETWAGEAKLAAHAYEVEAEGMHRFRLDVSEIVHTRVVDGRLQIRSWHPGRGDEVAYR